MVMGGGGSGVSRAIPTMCTGRVFAYRMSFPLQRGVFRQVFVVFCVVVVVWLYPFPRTVSWSPPRHTFPTCCAWCRAGGA